jgi:hypothetical protein
VDSELPRFCRHSRPAPVLPLASAAAREQATSDNRRVARNGAFPAARWHSAPTKTEAIVVFHPFEKKSQKTPVREIELARRRLRKVLNEKIEF